MQSDPNQPSLSDETVGFHLEKKEESKLIVVTFADAEQAQGLYDELVKLDKKEIISLNDAIFVTKNEDGEYEVDEKIHREKRTGTVGGAISGALIGMVLGGPILGLAGGAIIGRLVGKKMDLGIDKGTINSIAADLENGHTALFVYGTAKHAGTVLEVFKKFQGKVVSTTVEPEMQERLQKALEQESS
jgi:uncharacterized membrane protein